MDRSTITLPFHLRHLPNSSLPTPRTVLRSIPRLPPYLDAKRQSQEYNVQALGIEHRYDLLSLIQYFSEFPPTSGFETSGSFTKQSFPVCGRGRTFEVVRYSEGTKSDINVLDHWRPSKAIKCLRISERDRTLDDDSFRYRSFIQELRILRHGPLSKHPSFLRVMGLGWELSEADLTQFLPVIQTEFSHFSTLNSFLHSWQIPYSQKRRLILDVAEGISALHQCCIVHGDVKMENVLVLFSQDLDCPFVAKISDFGFSIDVSVHGESSGHLIGFSPLWAAPEVGDLLKYSQMHLTDVYSFGFVIWSVAIDGQYPLDHLEDLPHDPVSKLETFNLLKQSDELPQAAFHQFLTRPTRDSDVDFMEISDWLHCTLKLDPTERDLQTVVDHLRRSCPRREGSEASEEKMEPLSTFDYQKASLCCIPLQTGLNQRFESQPKSEKSRKCFSILRSHFPSLWWYFIRLPGAEWKIS
jgi:serine/threonine protein kinase